MIFFNLSLILCWHYAWNNRIYCHGYDLITTSQGPVHIYHGVISVVFLKIQSSAKIEPQCKGTYKLPCKHTRCIPRENDVEATVSTSFRRGIYVVCLKGIGYCFVSTTGLFSIIRFNIYMLIKVMLIKKRVSLKKRILFKTENWCKYFWEKYRQQDRKLEFQKQSFVDVMQNSCS